MFSNLPPNIQDYITQMKNSKVSMNIRYNYFTMLSNISKEVEKELVEFKKVMDKAASKTK